MNTRLLFKPFVWAWMMFITIQVALNVWGLLSLQSLEHVLKSTLLPIISLFLLGSVVGAIVVLLHLKSISKDTQGRTRVKILATLSLFVFLGQVGWGAAVFTALRWANAGWPEAMRTLFQVLDSSYLLPQSIQSALFISNTFCLSLLGMQSLLILSCWPLVGVKVKQVFFWVVDIGIVSAFGACIVLQFEKWVFVFAALLLIRALLRLFPWMAKQMESFGFHSFVAIRHIKAPKSNFLTAIGAISILSVAFSSCSLTTTLSVMGGFRQDLKKKILGTKAHIVIAKDYGRFDSWEPVIEKAMATNGVIAASPFVQGEVMVHSPSNLGGATLKGIELLSATEVTDLSKTIESGNLSILKNGNSLSDNKQKEGFQPPGIILGRELAKSLRVNVGDEITLVSPNGALGPTGPVPKTRLFQVSAIYYSGMYEYDMKMAYTSLQTAQRFLRTANAIDGIEIRSRSIEGAKDVAAVLNTKISTPKLWAKDWRSMNQNLFAALALEKIAMFTILGIAVLVAGFCVFGTLALLVQEKSKEVGILKAMGASENHIVRIFILEGFLIGFVGTSLGLGLGFISCYAAERFGIPMNPETYYIDTLPVFLDPLEFVGVGVMTISICFLATFLPSKLAGKIHPLDAIRYE